MCMLDEIICYKLLLEKEPFFGYIKGKYFIFDTEHLYIFKTMIYRYRIIGNLNKGSWVSLCSANNLLPERDFLHY